MALCQRKVPLTGFLNKLNFFLNKNHIWSVRFRSPPFNIGDNQPRSNVNFHNGVTVSRELQRAVDIILHQPRHLREFREWVVNSLWALGVIEAEMQKQRGRLHAGTLLTFLLLDQI